MFPERLFKAAALSGLESLSLEGRAGLSGDKSAGISPKITHLCFSSSGYRAIDVGTLMRIGYSTVTSLDISDITIFNNTPYFFDAYIHNLLPSITTLYLPSTTLRPFVTEALYSVIIRSHALTNLTIFFDELSTSHLPHNHLR